MPRLTIHPTEPSPNRAVTIRPPAMSAASPSHLAPAARQQRSGFRSCAAFVLGLVVLALAPGCAMIQHTAVNRLGDALAAGGTTYASDDDPELIKAAAPFSLKLIETLLAESPEHRGLRLAAASGFTQYAYAFVEDAAAEKQATDIDAAIALRQRARRLYLRARDHALRGLEVTHPGLTAALHADPVAAAAQLTRDDVALAYWAAASWAAAIVVIKNDPGLIAELPIVGALADRALALDEAFDHGALHTFYISYALAHPGGAASARSHFARAVELSGHQQAAPFVALAEGVAVAEQNRAEFESLLRAALAVDPDAHPEWRLANLVMQRRARRLLAQADDLVAP